MLHRRVLAKLTIVRIEMNINSRVVGYSEVIQFDGLSPSRRSGFGRDSTCPVWAFPVKLIGDEGTLRGVSIDPGISMVCFRAKLAYKVKDEKCARVYECKDNADQVTFGSI